MKKQLKYYASASELIPAIKTGAVSFGLLPEPAMTKALSMIEGSSMLFDLQELYGEQSYPQAVLVAKSSLIENYPQFIFSFVQAMKDNESYLPLNIESSVNAINSKIEEGLIPSLAAASITSQVIENCNINTEYAISAKQSVIDYLNAIIAIESSSANSVSDNFFADTANLVNSANIGSETLDINVFVPDGAPALAIAKLISENLQFGQNINYTVVSASNIGSKIIQKTADLALLPINAASKLAGNGTDYKMLTVNTHGNLYIIGTESAISLSDLKGQTIGVIGQGFVPDLTFKYILKNNSIGYELSV